MRPLFFVIFFSLISSLNTTTQAQNDFAKLEKNVNVRAKGLIQTLNTTKDTLILKSEFVIHKLYSVSEQSEREIDLNIGEKSIEIPLTNLTKGKHVFVAVQGRLRIVFKVILFEDDEMLLAMNDKKPMKKKAKARLLKNERE
ncbi:hypothetical protein WNY78_09690 [Psychroserpens sp. AS72]|uniref:hypothetical protein n=1 Tax=Psychroserpens sp. AS72 TaxID=3135775 RepID=UPI0031780EDE